MFKHLGSVYKEIRKSKNLTQAQVCDSIISRSNLASFEANKSMPSYEVMNLLLRQLDISWEELKYIANQYRADERQMLLQKFSNDTTTTEDKNLSSLYKKCLDYLDKYPNDLPIKNIASILEITLSVRKNGFNDDSHSRAEIIWKKIELYDVWYESDLKMLTTILFHFPVDTIHLITDKILDTLERYKDYKNIQPSQFSLLANLSTVYLYEDYIADCQHITTVLYNLSKRLKRYDYLGIAYTRLGICQKEFKQIKKGLEILNLTDETQLLTSMKKEVKNFHPTFPFD